MLPALIGLTMVLPCHAISSEYLCSLNNSAIVSMKKNDYESAIEKLESTLKHDFYYDIGKRNLLYAYNEFARQNLKTAPFKSVTYLVRAFQLAQSDPATIANLQTAVTVLQPGDLVNLENEKSRNEYSALKQNFDNWVKCLSHHQSSSIRKIVGGLYLLMGDSTNADHQFNYAAALAKDEHVFSEQKRIAAVNEQIDKMYFPEKIKVQQPHRSISSETPYEKTVNPSLLKPVPDFSEYIHDCREKILRQFSKKSSAKSTKYRVKVAIKIAADGKGSEVCLVASSGLTDVDNSALKAARLAVPFKPLPEGANENETFEFSLN